MGILHYYQTSGGGGGIIHQYLKAKLQTLWNLEEQFPLIDLGYDYYIVKLGSKASRGKILFNWPWFINRFFLSIQKWIPNFMPNTAISNTSAVWVRLLQLPTQFYDSIILQKIENSIGTFLKVDA